MSVPYWLVFLRVRMGRETSFPLGPGVAHLVAQSVSSLGTHYNLMFA